MWAPLLVLTCLLVSIVGVLPADLAEPTLTLTVSPQTCLAPCAIMTTTRIVPHNWNRWLVVQIEGPTFQGTMRQLKADSMILQIPFERLQEGDYDVLAILYRATPGKPEAGRARVTVVVRHN